MSLNILNINTISHILKHVSAISNNKEYEIKILWEREQTIRERESKLGWKGATKYLRGRKKLLEEGGVCCKWGNNMYFQFISRGRSKEYCVRRVGATPSRAYLRHCACAALVPYTMCLCWPKVVAPLQL